MTIWTITRSYSARPAALIKERSRDQSDPGAAGRQAAGTLSRSVARARRLAKRPMGALVIVGGVIAVLGAAAFPAAANASRSSNLAPSALQSPSARYSALMDYGAAMGDIVLFGGEIYGSVDGDTWTFNGTTWTQLSPSASPAARGDAMMAYDPAAGNMVLFGGS